MFGLGSTPAQIILEICPHVIDELVDTSTSMFLIAVTNSPIAIQKITRLMRVARHRPLFEGFGIGQHPNSRWSPNAPLRYRPIELE